jgi:hypothetical protein
MSVDADPSFDPACKADQCSSRDAVLRGQLAEVTDAFVQRRALDILSLPADAREAGFALVERLVRGVAAHLCSDNMHDFELWADATMKEMRSLVRQAVASGGSNAGRA